jgi:hypothetical protein
MMNSCELQAAIVTSDASVINTITSSLKKIGVSGAVYRDKESAMVAMYRTKVDAFFVDREIDPDLSLLTHMRKASCNSRALGFAIIAREQVPGGAFRVADFLVDKPLATQRLEQSLRAGHGMMLKERTRYFRKSIRIPVTLIDSEGHAITAMTTNLSQGGLGLTSASSLTSGQAYQAMFCLPGIEGVLNFVSRVVWSDAHGQSGLCFMEIAARRKQELAQWIEREFNAAMA